MSDLGAKFLTSADERVRRAEFMNIYKNSPIPNNEQLANLGIFMNGPFLARLLFMNELYQMALPIHGSVMEFGVRWGQNLAWWTNFRALYEPFNHNRKIIGFDTFAGFPSVHEKDGPGWSSGNYNVTDGYREYLEKILDHHEAENPIPHIKKYELRQGDATIEINKYLDENPQTIVSLAYFDFDIYEPTARCLEAIEPYLTKGSIIGFDELNRADFPGETVALREVFGLKKYSVRRSIYSRVNSYIVIE
jgi:hypothetical protein